MPAAWSSGSPRSSNYLINAMSHVYILLLPLSCRRFGDPARTPRADLCLYSYKKLQIPDCSALLFQTKLKKNKGTRIGRPRNGGPQAGRISRDARQDKKHLFWGAGASPLSCPAFRGILPARFVRIFVFYISYAAPKLLEWVR